MTDDRVCKCGHRAHDHIPGGGCGEGSKRCRCMAFRECRHERLVPWRNELWVCEECNHVQQPDVHDAALRAAIWAVIETRAKELKDSARAELSTLPVGDSVAGRWGDKIVGKATMSKGREKIVVNDPAALLEWVRKAHPTEVVESVNLAFMNTFRAVSGMVVDQQGELVPGVEVVQGEPYVSVRKTPDALAVVGELLASGRLGLDGIKQIEGA